MTIQLPLKSSETLWLSKTSVTKAWLVCLQWSIEYEFKIYSKALSVAFVKFYTHKIFTVQLSFFDVLRMENCA